MERTVKTNPVCKICFKSDREQAEEIVRQMQINEHLARMVKKRDEQIATLKKQLYNKEGKTWFDPWLVE